MDPFALLAPYIIAHPRLAASLGIAFIALYFLMWLANAVSPAKKLGPFPVGAWLHWIAANGPAIQSAIVKAESAAGLKTPPPPAGAVLVLILGTSLLARPAHAQTLTPPIAACARQLAVDSQQLAADTKAAPAVAATITADQARVNADVSACAVAAGVSQVTTHTITYSLGGAADVNAFAAVKSSAGKYILTPTGGGAGALFDIGFDQATDPSTKVLYELWHVSLVAMVNVLVEQGHSVAAAVFAALVGFQPSVSSPVFGLGPSAIVPFDGSAALVGVTLTAGLAAKIGQSVIPALTF